MELYLQLLVLVFFLFSVYIAFKIPPAFLQRLSFILVAAILAIVLLTRKIAIFF